MLFSCMLFSLSCVRPIYRAPAGKPEKVVEEDIFPSPREARVVWEGQSFG